jgi:hypothetical protein
VHKEVKEVKERLVVKGQLVPKAPKAPKVLLDQAQIFQQQIQSLLESCLVTSQLQATPMMFSFLLLMTLTLTTGGTQLLNGSRQQLRDITMFHFMHGGPLLE